MVPPVSLSSSVLWEILNPLTHTHDTTFFAFALCCRGTFFLLKPGLRHRYFFEKLRQLWKQQKIQEFLDTGYVSTAPDWPPTQEDHWGLLRCAARSGKLLFTQWVVLNWPLTPQQSSFNGSCSLIHCAAARSGNLALLQWMMEKWPLILQEIYGSEYWLLHSATLSGNLDMVQWLIEKWPPSDVVVYSGHYKLLQRAIFSGNFELVQWMIKTYREPLPEEVHRDACYMFIIAAESGNLATMKWLNEKWPPTDEDVCENRAWVLRGAARSGNLELVKWLVNDKKWSPHLNDFYKPRYNHTTFHPPLIQLGSNPEIHQYLKDVKKQLKLVALRSLGVDVT